MTSVSASSPRFKRKRILAEKLAPPALERGNVGLALGRDALEVAGVGDQARGNAVAGGRTP